MSLLWCLPPSVESSNKCLVRRSCWLPAPCQASSPGLSLLLVLPPFLFFSPQGDHCSHHSHQSQLASLFLFLLRLFSGIFNSLLTANTYMAETAPGDLLPPLKQFEVSLNVLLSFIMVLYSPGCKPKSWCSSDICHFHLFPFTWNRGPLQWNLPTSWTPWCPFPP